MSEPQDHRVLVIDDEAVVCLSCDRILAGAGYQVSTCQDPGQGLSEALSGAFDLVLLDIVLPGADGLDLLKRIKDAGVASEVIIMTGYSTVGSAVEAMKRGAADYIAKPFTPDELRVVVERALEHSALVRENIALREQLKREQGFEGIIGESRAMEQVFSVVKRVAPTDGTVLITGESGTGKEMVAHAIHRLSPRAGQAFVACDTGSLAPTLLESELFGHVKGSFSGAVATKQGLFEVADRGTLFLDEVATIGTEIQGKLLRVLESRRVKKVGDTAERPVDIRLVAATNRDLAAMVAAGTFREDLFYRLNVVPIQLPPLRERRGDIPKLAMIFLERFRTQNPTGVKGFTPEAMRLLECYAWPGNVRELKNMVERMAILCDAERIEARHVPAELKQMSPAAAVVAIPATWEAFKEMKQQIREAAVQELERRFLIEALRRSNGNISRAAEAIGMQRTNLHALLRKYGLTVEDL